MAAMHTFVAVALVAVAQLAHAGNVMLHHAVFMESNQRLIVTKLLNYGADVNCPLDGVVPKAKRRVGGHKFNRSWPDVASSRHSSRRIQQRGRAAEVNGRGAGS